MQSRKLEEHMTKQVRFHVLDHCIECNTCTSLAPLSFKIDPTLNQAIVIKQPTELDETRRCKDACEACPVGAIQYDPDIHT